MTEYDRAIHDAEGALGEALALSGLSWSECEDGFRRARLKGGLDAKIRSAEVPGSRLGGGDDPRAGAAKPFLEAGRRFGHALEAATASGARQNGIARAADALYRAVVALHAALRLAQWSREAPFRDIEQDAAHAIAYTYLTGAELADAREAVRLAGLYYELEGRLAAQYDAAERALDAYRNAAHQSARAEDFRNAARLAADEYALAAGKGEGARRVEARERQADYLLKAAEGADPEERSYLVWEAATVLFDVGNLIADQPLRRMESADMIRRGVDLVLAQPDTDIAVFIDDHTVSGRGVAIGAMRKAEGLYEAAGAFRNADALHYARRLFERRALPVSSPQFYLSVLLDLVWGYGTRPLRLLASGGVVLIVFAVIYAVALIAGAPSGLPAAVAVGRQALMASVRGFVSVPLLRWGEELGFGAGVLAPPGEYIGRVEGVFGVVLAAMALSMLGRWFRRNYVPRE
jgi:hypothetical protein